VDAERGAITLGFTWETYGFEILWQCCKSSRSNGTSFGTSTQTTTFGFRSEVQWWQLLCITEATSVTDGSFDFAYGENSASMLGKG